MQQIAIHLGGRKSQVCERSSDGKIVEERSCETRSLRAYLRQRPPSRVVIETCAEAFGVADAALELDTRCQWCRRRWSGHWVSE